MKSTNYELAKQLRHELHEHPELSNQEVWTKGHLIDFLEKHTKLEIVDRGLWFYAIYRAGKNKKNIAFRADFDALPFNEINDLPYKSKLPGVAHKCGHEGHAAALCGFALEVDQNGADKNIYFLFQHAEEIGEGAVYAQEMIKECNIDEIYAFHNMSGNGFEYKSVSVIDGTAHCSSKGMTIIFEGSPAHASQPETGKNPSYAVAEVVRAVPNFIDPAKHEGIILATIVNINVGKKAFGMSASKGEVSMTIRALYEKEMDALQKNLEDIAKSEAEKYGLKVSFEFQDYFPETSNSKETNDKIREVCKEKGFKQVEMPEAFRGSEDFGYYTKLTKGSMCYIGNGVDYPHVHTNEFDFRDELIETAVELFKGLIEQ